MIEIRELVIRVTVIEPAGERDRAGIEARLAELKQELLDACDERISHALERGMER
jgi:hypothetical protein